MIIYNEIVYNTLRDDCELFLIFRERYPKYTISFPDNPDWLAMVQESEQHLLNECKRDLEKATQEWTSNMYLGQEKKKCWRCRGTKKVYAAKSKKMFDCPACKEYGEEDVKPYKTGEGK